MTPLNRTLSRVSSSTLDGSFGPDRNRRIVVTLTPGDGKAIPDTIAIRPHGTRRAELGTVQDIYRYLLRCRIQSGILAKARERKARKAQRLADQRQQRAEKRLFSSP
jgi:hypothetical protein